ncbi:hypothetical protein ACFL39_00535 [Gemmatimonadota bacterium]
MPYWISCSKCDDAYEVKNIIALIDENSESHTGKLICPQCGNPGYIHQKKKMQEKGETWEPYIKAVLPVKSPYSTYSPYVFLIANGVRSKASSIHLNYYKDTRDEGGRLKHGAGPGGAPVLEKEMMIDLLKKLISVDYFTAGEKKKLANALRT